MCDRKSHSLVTHCSLPSSVEYISVAVSLSLFDFTECFCGNSLPSKHSHDCDMACKGNRDETCGGSNAITVYVRDGVDAGGGETEHLGCYRDDGTNRIMKMASTESGSMTPKVKNRT